MNAHSHTLQFAGSDESYRHGTVDFFDATCPICEAVDARRDPSIEFIQPVPGAAQTYLTARERLHRRLARTLPRIFGRRSFAPPEADSDDA